MEIKISIKAELRYFTATVEGREFRSDDTKVESLRKMWNEILDAKIFNEDEEQDDRWFDEEYFPEWPESIAHILHMSNNVCQDGWEFNQEY